MTTKAKRTPDQRAVQLKMAKARAAKKAISDADKDERGLSTNERAFVLHYLGAANRCAAEAAQLVGWGKSGRKSATDYAYLVMKRPHIIAEIDRLTAERNERLSFTADDVLRGLLVLKTEAELLAPSIQTIKARREILKDVGEHVTVGAFRRQVGLSSPSGGPIETTDVAALAQLTDEELDQLERARAILDRVAGKPPQVPDGGDDTGGEGTAPEGS